VARGDDLGHDRERRLGRRPTANIKADRPMEPIQIVI
jgi:hypothetical protein